MSTPNSSAKNTDAPLLQLQGLTKSFGGVVALKPLDLSVNTGEILGLVGENGAGKSTLIKLLSGIYQPDAGSIHYEETPVTFPTPKQAIETGIATIHQELEYAAHLTVAENMLLGEKWPQYNWFGSNFVSVTNWKALHHIARERLHSFGIDIPTEAQFESLSAVQKQEVAIANALAKNIKLLILDEPSAALTEPELKRLFGHLNRLREEGVSMIYVSHRLDEIFSLTDSIAILRDGELIEQCPTNSISAEAMISKMVGRELEQTTSQRKTHSTEQSILKVNRAGRTGLFHDVSFQVCAGEVVGLAGLVGAGRSELARAIYGLYPLDTGEMQLLGKEWKPKNALTAVRSGLVYIPEERKRQALVLDHSLKESISIGFTDLISKFGFVSTKTERSRVETLIETYDVRTSGSDQIVGTLSGGNQQKAILGRWFERDPQFIILDEPTRGVDVGAKAQIHMLIENLAAQGKGVLLISSDLPEVLALADRVLVMNRGTIETELTGEHKTEKNVILAASGLSEQEPTL